MRVEQLGTGDPEVALVGGIHGDEPCGEHAVEELLADPPDLTEPVLLIVANELALERGVRYVDDDLNRVFPGDPDADSHEGQLAAALAEEIAGCRTLVFHSTQSHGRPFALVDGLGAFERQVCPRLTLDAVVNTVDSDGGRIFEVAPETIEVECGYQLSAVAAENAVRAAHEFLAATGVLAGVDPPEPHSVPVFRLGEAVPKGPAERYAVLVENFEAVAAGQVFATADGEEIVADEPFYPVLMSAEGYADVFGYRAVREGSLP